VLHAGLDLGRGRLDFCLLDEGGEPVEVGAVAPDVDGLVGFARRVQEGHGPVRAPGGDRVDGGRAVRA
jgi:hypothetical protein